MNKPVEETKLPVKYNKEYYVIQANELVRSKQDELSLLEAKLVRLAIAQVLKDDTDLKTYTCNITDLADFLGISSQNIYRDVQTLSTELMKKSIFIRMPDNKKNYKILHWVDYIEYKDGIITFKLSEHLKEYLIGLNELFLRYQYIEILKLPTNYSIRLFELLYSYSSLKFREIVEETNYRGIELAKDEVFFTIDYLRDYFNCKEKYQNTADFIKRVINAAIEDINHNTIYPCSYRKITEHKKIIGIVFKLNDWNNGRDKAVINTLMTNYDVRGYSND